MVRLPLLHQELVASVWATGRLLSPAMFVFALPGLALRHSAQEDAEMH